MRVVAAFLACAAFAQAPPKAPALAWEEAPAPAWQAEGEGAWEAPPSPPPPSRGDVVLRVREDGSLRITDAKGGIRLSLGLPGRPRRIWRDGGVALEPTGTWAFPARTTLRGALGTLLFSTRDPREALAGLAWILDDGERRLTLVHPATGRALFLRLPEAQELELAFFPTRLELREGTDPGPRQSRRRWSLPWVSLVPFFARLVPPEVPSRATALNPFPKD